MRFTQFSGARTIRNDRAHAHRRMSKNKTRYSLEQLETRLALSIGGGWVSSTQSGQSGDGLLGQYYNNSAISGSPSFTRWDNRVDLLSPFSTTNVSGSPDPAYANVGSSGWSAHWTGTLTANFSESYTFRINSAGNGVRLWVTPLGQAQGMPLINNWASHGQTTDTGTMSLNAGQSYSVQMEYSHSAVGMQQIQLQWASPSTPLEDIEPATQIGVNVDGGDALFANMVNGGTRNYWWAPTNRSQLVAMDSNNWPTADGETFFGEGDTTTQAGGSYLVQFTGMATVSSWSTSLDWVVGGVDLHSTTLQVGQGYNPATNTTTATMIIPPSAGSGFYLDFTNTSRTSNSALGITSISLSGYTATVNVSSVAGLAVNQLVAIGGFSGTAVGYNGTYKISSVDYIHNAFTYQCITRPGVSQASGGTALAYLGNGITNLYVMQPTTTGGNTPIPVGTLFTPAALGMLGQYSTLRLMDLNATNGNSTSDWSDRTLPSSTFWSGRNFNSGTGVNTGVSGAQNAGIPWELQIALANETSKDIYINIPSNVSQTYITNLANLFAYGSDGVAPYTSLQATPVWKPLNSNLKVYIEYSNELWNSGFVQSETRSNGWANQLSQRALYDFLTNNQNDPLYPGGAANAYNDGASLAAFYTLDSGTVNAFLKTYNPNPSPSTDGGSPAYFNTSASINGYGLGQTFVGLRLVQISTAFKTSFGELSVNAVDTVSRVRPVFEWQYGGSWSNALKFIDTTHGAQHPMGYYLYAGGGGWYADDSVGGFTDVSFVNGSFSGLTGWTTTGSAGVVSNGSAMGNPNAPPLFSSIATTNGATESGTLVTITTNIPHNFVVGQSVTISGVTVMGYNGTFTIVSTTPGNFTYQNSHTGLANSGGGMVTGPDTSTQAAYLQPGSSIGQNVTFSGGYADLTLYITQTVPIVYQKGLQITLTPINGGPTINDGKPLNMSEADIVPNKYVWARTQAFYTGESSYTYHISFSSSLTSGNMLFDNLAIQTVNGMFNETNAAVRQLQLDVSGSIQSDVNLALQYGLHDVGYEGGFFFSQNLSGYQDINGYRDMGSRGFSSSAPNVGMYANLDPRSQQLAIDTLQQFYAAGGTLPIVYQSTNNINSWAVAPSGYNGWNTPKQQAVSTVEQDSQTATYGLSPSQTGTYAYWWLVPGSTVVNTYNIPAGNYLATVTFGRNPGVTAEATASVNVFIDGQVVKTLTVFAAKGGVFTVPFSTSASGQHSVKLVYTSPATGSNLFVGSPGSEIVRLSYVSQTSVPNATYTPVIIWPSATSLSYGNVLDPTQFSAVANVPGSFSLLSSGAILPSGVNTVSVVFTPTDTSDYLTTTSTATITVAKATPRISVIGGGSYNGAPIPATAMVSGAVDAVDSAPAVSLEGTNPILTYFAGVTASGIPLSGPPTAAGTYTVVANFPGSANYNPGMAQVTFTITQAASSVYWSSPAAIVYGTPLSAAQLNATASVPGTFTYSAAAGTILAAGSGQTLSITFTPADSTDYASATTSVTLDVAKAHLTVTALAQVISQGSAMPLLGYSISGFTNTDALTVVQGIPGLTTTATSSSLVGQYSISVSLGSLTASNYDFPNLVSASLTIQPNASLTIQPNVTDVRVSWGSQSMSILNLNRDLPFSTIKVIDVIFSSDVSVDCADLTLASLLTVGKTYSTGTFSYNPATHDARWTLLNALDVDKLRITLDGDVAGHNGIHTAGGTYLGAYSTDFSVLPGDFNGDNTVNSLDMVGIRNGMLGALDQILSVWADIDGNGTIDINDYNVAKARVLKHL
jgi:hypothetical protein